MSNKSRFFLNSVLMGIGRCDDCVSVELEPRGLLDSRSNLLHLGETFQREGLVKSWLRAATWAKQKRTGGSDSAELEVKNQVMQPLCVHFVVYGG